MPRKRKEKKEHKMDDSWLLPYADLLTLLLALFIVLFSMSEVDSQKYSQLAQIFKNELSGGTGILEDGGPPVVIPEDPPEDSAEDDEPEDSTNIHVQELEGLQELQEQVNQYILKSELSETLETLLTDEGLLITILNDVSFESGSAVVNEQGQEIAAEVGGFLATDPAHQIVISGHADDVPIGNSQFSSNWELSAHRAINFMRYILDNQDLNPDKFSAKGFGEHRALVPNTSEKNRAKNRRVEVLILPNYEIDTSGLETN